MIQNLPQAAKNHRTAILKESNAALRAVNRQWKRAGNDFDQSWSRIEHNVLAIVTEAQRRVTGRGEQYVTDVLDELNYTGGMDGRPNTGPLVGVTGAGWDLAGALGVVTIRAKQFVGAGATSYQARQEAGRWLTQEAGTAISDAGRGAEQIGIAARPSIHTYVRMVVPPACSRCAILAGTTWHTQTAFLRHPRCECRNIPAPDASSVKDMTVDVGDYFDSMSKAEQNRVFTNDGAEAIRNGADINQVVNARRGMAASQTGRAVRVKRGSYGTFETTEGITKRGIYGRSQGSFVKGSSKYRATKRARLMPEGIREISRDHAEYIRLLKLYKYIL